MNNFVKNNSSLANNSIITLNNTRYILANSNYSPTFSTLNTDPQEQISTIQYDENLQKEIDKLISYPNAHCVYRGKKIINGITTDQDCLCVLVTEKVPMVQLSTEQIIPSFVLDSIPTDVIQSPMAQFASACYQGDCQNDPKSKYRPLKSGISGMINIDSACTIGAIVRDSTDKSLVALTNNHCAGMLYDPNYGVMQEGKTSTLGEIAVQPSLIDDQSTDNVFGSVKRAVPFRVNGENFVDAAVYTIDLSVSPDIGMINVAEDIPLLFESNIDSYINQTVYKNGRTTCETLGTIIDTNATVSVSFAPTIVIFKNTIQISPIMPDNSNKNPVFQSVAYGNGLFVALGGSRILASENTRIVKSSDGINWTIQNLSFGYSTWTSITYGSGMFVAVGLGSTRSKIMKSSNGVDWETIDLNKEYRLNNIIYANGLFVCIGYNTVLVSSNAIDWQECDPKITAGYSIAYGNGVFVAVSFDGYVTSSPDGINWTKRNEPVPVDTETEFWTSWYDVTYANGLFVAVGSRIPAEDSLNTGGTYRVMTSTDGINWTGRLAPKGLWDSVVYGNGMFVAFALSTMELEGFSNLVMTSMDGINWTYQQFSSPYELWNEIIYENGLFVSVSGEGVIITSSDGQNWVVRSAETPNQSPLLYLAGGDSGSATITGQNKIIGLNFAGFYSPPCSYAQGFAYACRIDKVAEALQVQPWQGDIVVAKNSSPTITVNGRLYTRYEDTNDPITHYQ